MGKGEAGEKSRLGGIARLGNDLLGGLVFSKLSVREDGIYANRGRGRSSSRIRSSIRPELTGIPRRLP
jgi:hypothetical protein